MLFRSCLEACGRTCRGHISESQHVCLSIRQIFLGSGRGWVGGLGKAVEGGEGGLGGPKRDLPVPWVRASSPSPHPGSCRRGVCVTGPLGVCLRGPPGGRQEQAPSATGGSSTPSESARERPELGMTPPSTIPVGFIHRPQLRFPSPLHFPALFSFFLRGLVISN